MVGINILAILASAVTSLIIGSIWYALLFREPYLKGLGKSVEELAKGPSILIASLLQFLGCFVIASVLAWLMVRTRMDSVGQGIVLAILIWIGFIVAVIGPMYAYQAFSLKFFLIVVGNLLLILIVSAVILGAWR